GGDLFAQRAQLGGLPLHLGIDGARALVTGDRARARRRAPRRSRAVRVPRPAHLTEALLRLVTAHRDDAVGRALAALPAPRLDVATDAQLRRWCAGLVGTPTTP